MQKQDILKIITQRLERNISELSRSLESYATASDMDESDTVDPDDFSKATEYKEMQMRMQVQLDTARAQLVRLQDLSSKDHSVAEVGALIETDKNWLFLGISFSNMSVEGHDILGISPESPAYLSIKGKQKGDSFKLGKEEYTIHGIH